MGHRFQSASHQHAQAPTEQGNVLHVTGVKCAYTECSDVGLERGDIPDKNLHASSAMNSDSYPSNARLNNNEAWAAHVNDKEPWLQVKLNQSRYVTAVVTQGFRGSFVTVYYLSYGEDEQNLSVYTVQGRLKVTLFCCDFLVT